MNRLFAVAMLALTSFTLVALIARAERLCIILSDSAAPAGIYRKITAPLTHGQLVLACLPLPSAHFGLKRGYLGAGDCVGGAEPVAKIVGALPGDIVEIESGWVAINGTRIPASATFHLDSVGRPLAHTTWGIRRVRNGEVWLFGFNNPRSWDARYVGGIPATSILGDLTPVVTW